MAFYRDSTGNSSPMADTKVASSFHPFVGPPSTLPSKPLPLYFGYYNNFCNQFLQISDLLTKELILNNCLIVARRAGEAQEEVRSDCEVVTIDTNKNGSQYEEFHSEVKPIMEKKESRTKRRRRVESEEEQSYKPDFEDSKEVGVLHVSQSKNIPKNYGKAIVNYIYRSETEVKRTLLRMGIDFEAFMTALNKVKNSLNTIMQLRSLWLEEDNPYAKAYRVLSMQYLRKHCLPYIFNSRVQNFHKHIKYRYKMMEGVSQPLRFTHMKQF